MPWVKLDAGFPDHPKVVAAGWKAAWLYVCGLTYCTRYLTDGRIPKAQVKRLSDIPRPECEADKLVRSGLWIDDETDYIVHDYMAWQTPSDKVMHEREEGRKRAKASAEARAKKARSTGAASPEDRQLEGRRKKEEESSSSSSDSRPPADQANSEEEEDFATAEARRRLASRQGPPVTNVEGWVRTVAANVRLEPKAKPAPTAAPPDCATCKDVALAEPCPDCGRRAA